MRHLASTEIKNHTLLFFLSNSTHKVAHFLTTIFGSVYHDRGKLTIKGVNKAVFILLCDRILSCMFQSEIIKNC